VVVAAFQATVDPAFNTREVQKTNENVAPVPIVKGLIVRRLRRRSRSLVRRLPRHHGGG
jgi:hypothetical protein